MPSFCSEPFRLFQLVSCASLLTRRVEETLGRKWSYIVDFSQAGDLFLGFLSFYNIRKLAKIFIEIPNLWMGHDTSEPKNTEPKNTEPKNTEPKVIRAVCSMLDGFLAVTDLLSWGARRKVFDQKKIAPFTTAGYVAAMLSHGKKVYTNIWNNHSVSSTVSAVSSFSLYAFLFIGALQADRSGLIGKIAKYHMIGMELSFAVMTVAMVYRFYVEPPPANNRGS